MAELLQKRRSRRVMAPTQSASWQAPAPSRLAFIHIPKTAGTSVTDTLARAYAEVTFPGMTTLDYRCYTDDELAKFNFYKGHAYRRDYERLPGDTVKFTVMREPLDRVISLFAYYRDIDDSHITDDFMREASKLAKTGGALEFIHSDSPFIIEHVRLGQMRQFLSAETLEKIGHRLTLTRSIRHLALQEFIGQMACMQAVLTCEMLFLSFPLMLDYFGLPKCSGLGQLNASKRPADVDLEDARRMLIEVNGTEFAAYDHVRRREQAWIAGNLSRLCSLAPDTQPGAGHD